jgi:L-iditol 2-dehydrogenase
VAEVGRAVTGFAPGDPVTFMPQVTCGACYPCRHGQDHICESLKVMGFQTSGAAQEYFAIDADKVLRVPAGIPLDQAAMIEPVSVGVHALARAGSVAGKKVLVLGAGTIGNLTAQVARASGAAGVMITDVNPYKLAKARECGFEFVVNTREEDLGAALGRDFGPDRADLILECVGAQATISQAVAHARKGTTLVVVGVFGEQPRVDVGLIQDRELSLNRDADVPAGRLRAGDRPARRGQAAPGAADHPSFSLRALSGSLPDHRGGPRRQHEGDDRPLAPGGIPRKNRQPEARWRFRFGG